GSYGVWAYHGENSASDAGAAYVFVRTGTTWTLEDYLKASNAQAADNFGCSVSITDNWIVVGANGEDSNAVGVGGTGWDNNASNSGAAYAFPRVGPFWLDPILIKASNTSVSAAFGTSVSVNQNTLVVGATLEDSTVADSGAAYVFTFNGTVWSQQALLKASNPGAQDNFGITVSVSN